MMNADKKQYDTGAYANFPENSDCVGLPWNDGVKLDKKIKTPIEYNLDTLSGVKGFEPEKIEYFRAGYGQILINKRTLEVIKSLTTKYNIYESTILYQNHYLKGKYYTVNLETASFAANLDLSDYRSIKTGSEDEIAYFNDLILSQKKIDQIPKGEHLFRLQECSPYVIISEYGKNLIEENGIIGVEFDPLEIAD